MELLGTAVLVDDVEVRGQRGNAVVDVQISQNSVSLCVLDLVTEYDDGTPVVLEQHNGELRLLLYVDDFGKPLQYPRVIKL